MSVECRIAGAIGRIRFNTSHRIRRTNEVGISISHLKQHHMRQTYFTNSALMDRFPK